MKGLLRKLVKASGRLGINHRFFKIGTRAMFSWTLELTRASIRYWHLNLFMMAM